jgi:hypothetical protein
MDQLPGGGVSDFQDIARVSAELAVTVGIVEAAVMQNDETPDEVKENFGDKVDAVVEYLNGEILEFQAFGEAYDDEAS